MKRIFTVLAVAALSCGTVCVAMAQTGDQGEKPAVKKAKSSGAGERMMPAPEVQLKRLTKGLKLTSEQQKQIRPMLKEEYARLKEIRQDANLNPKQIQEKVQELRTGTIARIQSVLTPEQKEKHDRVSNEIKANKQRRMQENRKARIGTNADPPSQEAR